jgi:hypothetical protein
MRKLVYLAYTFPPVSTGSAPMNLKLARLFLANGWAPHVITPGVASGLPLDPSLDGLLPEEVQVVRTGRRRVRSIGKAMAGTGTQSARKRFPGRLRDRLRRFILEVLLQPDRHVTWFPTAVTTGVREVLRSKAEIIVSLGPPHSVHLAGLACSLLTGRPWVAYFGDLWVRDGYIDWESLPSSRIYWSGVMEGLVVRSADGIITTTDGSSGYFTEIYGSDCPPVCTLWNGVSRAERQAFWNPAGVPPLGEELVITYTGFFMGNQSPEYFLLGLRLFLDRHPGRKVRFRIVGEMGVHSGLPRAMGLTDSVDIVGKVPFSEVRSWQLRSHLLLILLPPQPGNELKNAAKTAEYLLARRPVLAVAAEGDMTGLIRRLDAGYTAGHDAGSICSALEQAYEDLGSGRHKVLGDPGDLDGVMDMDGNGRDMVRFLESLAGL